MKSFLSCPICGSIHLRVRADGNYTCGSCGVSFVKKLPDGGTTEEVYQNSVGSILEIKVISNDEEIYGTGVVISNDGLILTNAHVVMPFSDSSQPIKNFCDAVLASRKETRDDFPIRPICSDRALDLALMYSENAEGIRPLALSEREVSNGQSICVIGNSKGEGLCVVDGIVSDTVRVIGRRKLMMISAPVTTGYSGGPVLDRDGRIVGLVTGGHEGAAAMNYAVPASVIRDFLATAKTK